MRLLIVTQTVDEHDPVLGFFVSWVTALAQECEEVHVLALNVRAHTLPSNVHVCSLGKDVGAHRLIWLWRLWSHSIALRARYDSVFVHMTPIHMVVGGLLWRLLGKRIGLWYTHSSVDLKLRVATVLTHYIFTASAESFLLNSPKKIVTGHGINPQAFPFKAEIDAKEPQLIVVGRVSPIKHVEHAIQTLAQLRPTINATLTIVGEPGSSSDRVYRDGLLQLVQELSLGAYVTWKGAVAPAHIGGILGKHDVFLHTSQTQSTDKTLLEAMLAGLLVVTANTAFQKVVPENCFSTANPDDYASRVRGLLTLSSSEQSTLRKSLRTYVEDTHNLRALARRIVGVYARDFKHHDSVT